MSETVAPAEHAAPDAETAVAPPVLALEGLSLRARGERLGPVDLAVAAGERIAVLAEDGHGLAALLSALAGETRPASGQLRLGGARLDRLRGRARRRALARMSILWRDPHAAFDPARALLASLAQSLAPSAVGRRLPMAERQKRLIGALSAAGADAAWADVRPAALAPAELQRMALARAIAPMPDLLVLDEPLARLDAAERGLVADRLAGVGSSAGPATLLLTAEPALAARLATRVAVLHAGRIVEEGPAREVLTAPRHPYARRLVATVSAPGAALPAASGPAPPGGCAFAPACPLAAERCRAAAPRLDPAGAVRVACHAVQEGRDRAA